MFDVVCRLLLLLWRYFLVLFLARGVFLIGFVFVLFYPCYSFGFVGGGGGG